MAADARVPTPIQTSYDAQPLILRYRIEIPYNLYESCKET